MDQTEAGDPREIRASALKTIAIELAGVCVLVGLVLGAGSSGAFDGQSVGSAVGLVMLVLVVVLGSLAHAFLKTYELIAGRRYQEASVALKAVFVVVFVGGLVATPTLYRGVKDGYQRWKQRATPEKIAAARASLKTAFAELQRLGTLTWTKRAGAKTLDHSQSLSLEGLVLRVTWSRDRVDSAGRVERRESVDHAQLWLLDPHPIPETRDEKHEESGPVTVRLATAPRPNLPAVRFVRRVRAQGGEWKTKPEGGGPSLTAFAGSRQDGQAMIEHAETMIRAARSLRKWGVE